MLELMKSLLELISIIGGIYLIISGTSKNEKFKSIDLIKKRNLYLGIALLILTLIVAVPDMYTGFINGWNEVYNMER